LNSYAQKGTTPSRWRVCLFHHLGLNTASPTTTGHFLHAVDRSGGTRTPDRRFWRPLLYQTELHSSAASKSGV
jgi:hypothetical protein